jgi:RHS repeat-associated protein
LEITKTFDNFGFPEQTEAYNTATMANVFDYTYDFEQTTGNLLSRHDAIATESEAFEYDDDNYKLNRLSSITINNALTPDVTIDYTTGGNIQYKTEPGTYYHTGSQPHAVTQVSNENLLVSGNYQEITYNAFNKVSLIQEDYKALHFTYGVDNERRKTVLYDDGDLVETKYYSANYEKIITPAGTRELHYISATDGLCAVYIKEGSTGNLYFACTDYLGSILALANSDGSLAERYSFDAWGRRRDPADWNSYTLATTDFLIDRGFTGHEHLDAFGLINMNGRLYDPIIGRMLSPDNYVQSSTYAQSFNRYSYCFNNPLKYTDPSGDFFEGTITTFTIDFFRTLGSGGLSRDQQTRRDAWQGFDPRRTGSRTNNAWQIDIGRLTSDPKRTDLGRVWQVISKNTWELPQMSIGYGTSHFANIAGNVQSVSHYGGATAVEMRNEWWIGITHGNYIIVAPNELGIDNSIFQHEFGHYLQSQSLGVFYYQRIGIPSMFSKSLVRFNPVEQDANKRALSYFLKNESSFTNEDWHINPNPIDNYNISLENNNPDNQIILQSNKLGLSWHDILLGPNIFLSGIINMLYFNSQY